jgi:hypothetical protein
MATQSPNLSRVANDFAQSEAGKLLLGLVGGALAITLLPTLLRFTVRLTSRMIVGVILKAIPIILAGLLAERAAEEID